MKVICITPTTYDRAKGRLQLSPVKIGKTYNVIKEEKHWDGVYYGLAGFDEEIGFNANCFIPLSDIDEKDFNRNYSKSLK